MIDELSTRLAAKVRQLRHVRRKTQPQMARLAALQRATWSNLESGTRTRRWRCFEPPRSSRGCR